MPKFNRRSFLQMIGAASLAPAIPSLPAQAATAGGASHAQLLWASMYRRAGSASKFARVTQGLGISATTTQRLQAKLVGSRVLMAEGAVRAQRVARPAPRVLTTSPKDVSPKGSFSKARKMLIDDADLKSDLIPSPDIQDQPQKDATEKPCNPE